MAKDFVWPAQFFTIEVSDMNFSDTFSAQLYEDWYFHKWNSGDGFF
jgi:hypothetical protein